MGIQLGVFVRPDARNAQHPVELIVAADRAGLDLVGVQDHPYQRRLLDTWTLLSYAAARTERIRLVPDVANLPLRPPAMLAKAAASLDVLSGGRIELGLGAGAFWDGIASIGGPRRTPRESVDALIEAIGILRTYWAAEDPVNAQGEHYVMRGAKGGPPPAHRIGIWLGAYGPRMLRVTGRLADGWLPSLAEGYMSAEDAPAMQRAVDEAAKAAGRDPAAIERVLNVMPLDADRSRWADQLSPIIDDLGFTTLIAGLPGDDSSGAVRYLGEEVAPTLRGRFG